MKDISDFLQTLDVDEIKDDLFNSVGYPIFKNDRELFSTISFRISLDILIRYHNWLASDEE